VRVSLKKKNHARNGYSFFSSRAVAAHLDVERFSSSNDDDNKNCEYQHDDDDDIIIATNTGRRRGAKLSSPCFATTVVLDGLIVRIDSEQDKLEKNESSPTKSRAVETRS